MHAIAKAWRRRLKKLRGGAAVETDLSPYEAIRALVEEEGRALASYTDARLRSLGAALRRRGRNGETPDALLPGAFALAREAAHRVLGLRPFDGQVVAGVALHRGKLAEMQTGEGKTLAAVLPAYLNGLAGRGVHVLTFNDYLARRDAAWMGPVYRFLGLRVGAVQEGMSVPERQAAYRADVTYVTAKEAGFDFLRMHLCRDPAGLVHRPFHYAIVDEADSILIDEARVPLVVAGQRPGSSTSLYRIAEAVGRLEEGVDWEKEEQARNVHLTDRGLDRVEGELGCGDLHAAANYLLLTEVNQALHARALLSCDVDYIVRGDRIELVDEFTGRVVDDRRWPDGLQAALEAKEGVPIRPGGWILGSVTLQHFLKHYPRLGGMTATAQAAAEELSAFYGLEVVVIPPHRPCIRKDRPDVIFTHREAKFRALLAEVARVHAAGRPVLVGTGSVEESEALAAALREQGIRCEVLNAKNDAEEARIIARAGMPGAVTISTNMAGRGTDIRLGGEREQERDRVVALGGLYVIGTTRHESRRIDDQLRGRAGRQGDPGASRFFISLEDALMVRFGLDALIPPRYRPPRQEAPVSHSVLRREIDRLQRIVEGQNFEIRRTLWRYSEMLEEQRRVLQGRRRAVLVGEAPLGRCAALAPERYRTLKACFGEAVLQQVDREITLFHMDRCWAEHLAYIAQVREGIHLVGLGGLNPLDEFHKLVARAFLDLQQTLDARIVETFESVAVTRNGIDVEKEGLEGPASTWTYLVNDRVLSDLQQMLFGGGSTAFAAGAALTAGPLLFGWALYRRLFK